MTIREAIEFTDAVKKNSYSFVMKVRWLNDLDHRIWNELICTHEDQPAEDLATYSGTSDSDTDLLVPDPYAVEMYNYYLQSCIDKENGEMTKYAASAALFNNAYKDYYSTYNRLHMPITKQPFFKF